MCTNPFCLGLYWCLEWDCCGKMDAEPEPKRKKLDRFAKPTSPTSMSKICEGYIPPNTGKATKWASSSGGIIETDLAKSSAPRIY